MIAYIKKIFASRYAHSLARTVMSAIAGYLLATGVDPELVNNFQEPASELLAAVAVILVTQGWSFIDKAKTEKKDSK